VILPLRGELLKLRTTGLTYGLLVTSAGLTALLALLAAAQAGGAVAPLSTASGLSTVTTTTGLALLFAAVLGVTVSSGEFRHQTATTTYLSFPDRNRVLVAKAVAAAVAGAVYGLAAGVVATAIGLIFVAAKGGPVALSVAAMAAHAGGAALGAALLAAAGAGLGSLVRGQLGAVIGTFAWAVVIESFLGGLVRSIQPYLPFTAATTLAGTKLGEALLVVRVATGPGPLPFPAAAGLILATAVAFSAAAALFTVPRDIT
jgi:ABC-type transport system involved in multi-copper enzyme maturation permease subunit